MLGFRQPLGDLNSGPHASKTSTLPTEPSSQCRYSLLLYPRAQKSGFPAGYHVGSRVAVCLRSTSQNFQGQLCPEEPIGEDSVLDGKLSGLIPPVSQVV